MRHIPVILTSVFGLALGGAAQAGLTFCNDSDVRASVAIGYHADGVWTSEGWWGVDPQDCTVVQSGDLTQRYYYWRATYSGGEFPSESYFFCTSSQVFTIEGDENCEARGYRREAFNEVDTGQSRDYTVALNLPNQEAPRAPAAPVARDPWAPRGTYGEPYSITATFQGCYEEGDAFYCEFTNDGWLYIASTHQPNDIDLLEDIMAVDLGTQMGLAGDLVYYEGSQAEITIQEWETYGGGGGGGDAHSDPRGTHGEPYSITATFEGCYEEGDAFYCEFTADGWLYIASTHHPTDIRILDDINYQNIGSQVALSGDLVFYEGSQADITITSWEPLGGGDHSGGGGAPAGDYAELVDHMQGYWTSDDDDSYYWHVDGTRLTEFYDGNIQGVSFFEIHPECAASYGQGPVVIAWPEVDTYGDGPSCYLIQSFHQRGMEFADMVSGRSLSFTYDP